MILATVEGISNAVLVVEDDTAYWEDEPIPYSLTEAGVAACLTAVA